MVLWQKLFPPKWTLAFLTSLCPLALDRFYAVRAEEEFWARCHGSCRPQRDAPFCPWEAAGRWGACVLPHQIATGYCLSSTCRGPPFSFSAAGTFFSAFDPVSTLLAFLPQVVQLSTWVRWPLTSLPAEAAALRCRLSISVARLMFSELLYTISSMFLFVPLFLYIFFLFLGFS